MVTLQNKSKRLQTYNLDHESLESAEGPHGYRDIETTVVEQAPDGSLYPSRQQRRVPSALTLAAGESRTVSDDVIKCSAVAAAIKRQELRVIEQHSDAPADAKASTDDAKAPKAVDTGPAALAPPMSSAPKPVDAVLAAPEQKPKAANPTSPLKETDR